MSDFLFINVWYSMVGRSSFLHDLDGDTKSGWLHDNIETEAQHVAIIRTPLLRTVLRMHNVGTEQIRPELLPRIEPCRKLNVP